MVHRDAEREPRANRVREIESALAAVQVATPPAVCVVPVRMTEAWLLVDEAALRTAADNPHGTCRLDLPPPRQIEALPNPKELLHRLLETATELSPRRRSRFSVGRAVQRVGALTRDYSQLRALSAFVEFEGELGRVLAGLS